MKWPQPAVSGLLFDDKGRVLLMRASQFWRLPGGRLDGGRNWITSLSETVSAVTSIAISDQRLLGIYTGESGDRVVASFLVTRFEGTPRCGEQVEELGWFAPEQLPETLEPGDRRRIDDALHYQGDVFVR